MSREQREVHRYVEIKRRQEGNQEASAKDRQRKEGGKAGEKGKGLTCPIRVCSSSGLLAKGKRWNDSGESGRCAYRRDVSPGTPDQAKICLSPRLAFSTLLLKNDHVCDVFTLFVFDRTVRISLRSNS